MKQPLYVIPYIEVRAYLYRNQCMLLTDSVMKLENILGIKTGKEFVDINKMISALDKCGLINKKLIKSPYDLDQYKNLFKQIRVKVIR